MTQELFLELRSIRKAFGSFTALHDINLQIRKGEFVCFLGPSGCGKTTLLRIIAGLEVQTSGEVFQAGRDISRLPPAQRDYGIVFQSYALFPNLSVLENVRLAVQATQEGKHRRGLNLWSIWSDHAALTRRAHEILEAVSMSDRQNAPVSSLPHGDQRKIEVALLMALDPLVYMFDEPTAGMSHDEAPVILDLIRALKKDKNKTILLVEHKMDVVRELADRIIVLHNGTLVADGDPATVIASPVVQEAYLGVAKEVA